ncbi:T9SS type A sorting domain-containing protein [Pedobacter sp. BS3]|uniref:T9SS type A sorting domain-containing protein n=1 Tax=Pedobacter sp. BS3 TaxID=2567937 RepID=UPI0011EE4C4F|nr:T9SS type A sorting domain-containing protein [Pedobacter sp. BS3]
MVYPNPAKEALHINMDDGDYTRLSMSDVNGKQMKTVNLPANVKEFKIDTYNYPPGYYIIYLDGVLGRIVKTFVKVSD